MKTTLAVTASALALLTLSACVVVPVKRPVPPPVYDLPADYVMTAAEVRAADVDRAEYGRLTNIHREKNRLVPVTESLQLSAAAQAHADDMRRQGYFSHKGANGSRVRDRVEATGYYWAFVAENNAMGFHDEEAVVEAFMDSKGHKANMLARDAREFGVGRNGDIWVMLLGARP